MFLQSFRLSWCTHAKNMNKTHDSDFWNPSAGSKSSAKNTCQFHQWGSQDWSLSQISSGVSYFPLSRISELFSLGYLQALYQLPWHGSNIPAVAAQWHQTKHGLAGLRELGPGRPAMPWLSQNSWRTAILQQPINIPAQQINKQNLINPKPGKVNPRKPQSLSTTTQRASIKGTISCHGPLISLASESPPTEKR